MTHSSEAQRPIIGLSNWFVYKYPEKANAIACDGTEAYPHDQARLEFDVFAAEWPDKTAPTEHFEVRMFVDGPKEELDRHGVLVVETRRIWTAFWRHQNTPPHRASPTRGFEVVQANQYNILTTYKPGVWKLRAFVTGLESGNQHITTCEFFTEG